DPRQLAGRVEARRGPAGRQRDHVGLLGKTERVVHHLLGVRLIAVGQRVDLPLVAVLLDSRRERRGGADGGAAARGGRYVAELGQAPVRACGGEVVDLRLGRQRPRGGQLLPRLEHAVVDRAREAVDELLRDRRRPVPVQARQVYFV